mmetsp:Transcript_65918/g.130729  ORF Transcript_65918/g.130729 Transcript_65918/m.130729 type:complete len:218 (-) Transcript_65918:195-848(-)
MYYLRCSGATRARSAVKPVTSGKLCSEVHPIRLTICTEAFRLETSGGVLSAVHPKRSRRSRNGRPETTGAVSSSGQPARLSTLRVVSAERSGQIRSPAQEMVSDLSDGGSAATSAAASASLRVMPERVSSSSATQPGITSASTAHSLEPHPCSQKSIRGVLPRIERPTNWMMSAGGELIPAAELIAAVAMMDTSCTFASVDCEGAELLLVTFQRPRR